MWESRRIEIPGEGCTSLPRHGKTWVKFCVPTLHFLMERTEGKNSSFMAIKIRIHQKFSSMAADDPLVDLKFFKKNGAGGYAQISDFYVIYLLCYSIAGHSLAALMYLKT